MKPKLAFTLAVILLAANLASIAIGRDQGFAWDPNPEPDVVAYRLYTHSITTDTFGLAMEVADDPATPENDTPVTALVTNIPNFVTRVYVTAVNAAGLESLPSEELILEAVAPGAPQGFRKVVSLQTSVDGVNWNRIADYYFQPDDPLFTRLELREEAIPQP